MNTYVGHSATMVLHFAIVWVLSASLWLPLHAEDIQQRRSPRSLFYNRFTELCGTSPSEPTALCMSYPICLASGGSLDDRNTPCSRSIGFCCSFHHQCDGTLVEPVGYWQSENYPRFSSKNGPCTFTIQPMEDVCYVKIDFLDTILNAPVSNGCSANTLTIYSQKEGDGSMLCGALTNYQTFVAVDRRSDGVARDIKLLMTLKDNISKYKIRLTQIQCDQISRFYSVRDDKYFTRNSQSISHLLKIPRPPLFINTRTTKNNSFTTTNNHTVNIKRVNNKVMFPGGNGEDNSSDKRNASKVLTVGDINFVLADGDSSGESQLYEYLNNLLQENNRETDHKTRKPRSLDRQQDEALVKVYFDYLRQMLRQETLGDGYQEHDESSKLKDGVFMPPVDYLNTVVTYPETGDKVVTVDSNYEYDNQVQVAGEIRDLHEGGNTSQGIQELFSNFIDNFYSVEDTDDDILNNKKSPQSHLEYNHQLYEPVSSDSYEYSGNPFHDYYESDFTENHAQPLSNFVDYPNNPIAVDHSNYEEDFKYYGNDSNLQTLDFSTNNELLNSIKVEDGSVLVEGQDNANYKQFLLKEASDDQDVLLQFILFNQNRPLDVNTVVNSIASDSSKIKKNKPIFWLNVPNFSNVALTSFNTEEIFQIMQILLNGDTGDTDQNSHSSATVDFLSESVTNVVNKLSIANKQQPDSALHPTSKRHETTTNFNSHPTSDRHETTTNPTNTRDDIASHPTSDRHDTSTKPTTTRHDITSLRTSDRHETSTKSTTTRHDIASLPTSDRHETTTMPTTTRHDIASNPTTDRHETSTKSTTTRDDIASHPSTEIYVISHHTATKRQETSEYPITEGFNTYGNPSTETHDGIANQTNERYETSENTSTKRYNASENSTTEITDTNAPNTVIRQDMSTLTTKGIQDTITKRYETTQHPSTERLVSTKNPTTKRRETTRSATTEKFSTDAPLATQQHDTITYPTTKRLETRVQSTAEQYDTKMLYTTETYDTNSNPTIERLGTITHPTTAKQPEAPKNPTAHLTTEMQKMTTKLYTERQDTTTNSPTEIFDVASDSLDDTDNTTTNPTIEPLHTTMHTQISSTENIKNVSDNSQQTIPSILSSESTSNTNASLPEHTSTSTFLQNSTYNHSHSIFTDSYVPSEITKIVQTTTAEIVTHYNATKLTNHTNLITNTTSSGIRDQIIEPYTDDSDSQGSGEISHPETSVQMTEEQDGHNFKNEQSAQNNRLMVNLLSTLSNKDLIQNLGKPRLNSLCEALDADVRHHGLDEEESSLPALKHLAPYYGTLMVLTQREQYFFCSVTLISDRHVLTAASCILRKGYDTVGYKMRVFFNLGNLPPKPRTWALLWNQATAVEVTKAIFHPMADHDSFDYNVAVLHLAEIMDIQPIPFVNPLQETSYSEVHILSHSVSSKTNSMFDASYFNTKARFVKGELMANDVCNKRFEGVNLHFPYAGFIHVKSNTFCVDLVDNFQTCEGSQGSPVVYGFPDRPRLVGIVGGNMNNCVRLQRSSSAGEYPDLVVRISAVQEFIDVATSTLLFNTGQREAATMNFLGTLGKK